MSFNSRSLVPPTAPEIDRQAKCKAAGCEACNLLGLPRDEHCGRLETHHILVGGQRVGERYTVCLGAYHHQGKHPGRTRDQAIWKYGPNLLDHKIRFRATFGSDQTLLNSQDDRIGHEREDIPSRKKERRGDSPASRPTKIFRGFA